MRSSLRMVEFRHMLSALGISFVIALSPLKSAGAEMGYQEICRDHSENLVKLAEAGKPKTQFWLGLCYFYGVKFEKDPVKAAVWFRKAADQSFPNAQALLGFMYQDGNGVEKDLSEAAGWLRKAADQNLTQAVNGLVWLLATTRDASVRNPDEALRYGAKLDPSVASEADTFAAALAAAGSFEKAIETQTAAMALARAAGSNISGYALRLALYQSGQALSCPGMEACN